MDKLEAAKMVVTGMTLDQMLGTMAFTVLFVIGIISLVIWINKNQSAAMKESLKPLQRVPEQLDELNLKVKSGEDLNRMIEVKLQDHALNCPGRLSCNVTPNKRKIK